jgi:hypothetical protein
MDARVGGHRTCTMEYNDVSDFICSNVTLKLPDIQKMKFCFIEYVNNTNVDDPYIDQCYLKVNMPMQRLVQFVPLARARELAKMHGIEPGSQSTLKKLKLLFEEHLDCSICNTHVTVISAQPVTNEYKRVWKQQSLLKKTVVEKQLILEQTQQRVAKHRSKKNNTEFETCDLTSVFPPPPVDRTLSHQIINAACSKLKPESFEEAGCAICGQLVPASSLSRLSAVKKYLHILEAPGYTRQERHKMLESPSLARASTQ